MWFQYLTFCKISARSWSHLQPFLPFNGAPNMVRQHTTVPLCPACVSRSAKCVKSGKAAQGPIIIQSSIKYLTENPNSVWWQNLMLTSAIQRTRLNCPAARRGNLSVERYFIFDKLSVLSDFHLYSQECYSDCKQKYRSKDVSNRKWVETLIRLYTTQLNF